MYIFKDFNDEITLEDQQLTGSTLDIPSMAESTISRHTSIYLSQPGKYSVFIIDKKLPMMFKHFAIFEGEEPCALLKVSHSIQPFSPDRIVASSIGILSVWPRRVSSGSPFYISSSKNFEVDIFPNTLKLKKSEIPEIKFTVIDMMTNKKLYNISPDKVTLSVPVRKVQKKNGLEKIVKEVRIRCIFKADTIKNVIGGGRILTVANSDLFSDISLVPYYIIVDGEDENDQMDEVQVQQNKTETSQQQVKDKLTLKQQRQERSKSISKLTKCSQNCQNGDCNKYGKCVWRKGWIGEKCDKNKVGKLGKIKQKELIQANKNNKKTEDEIEEDYDYDDDEDMLNEITTTATPPKIDKTLRDVPQPKSKPYQYGLFDLLLLFLLLLGIALIFYQNLWSGRF